MGCTAVVSVGRRWSSTELRRDTDGIRVGVGATPWNRTRAASCRTVKPRGPPLPPPPACYRGPLERSPMPHPPDRGGRLDPHTSAAQVVLHGALDPFQNQLTCHLHEIAALDAREGRRGQVLAAAHDLARMHKSSSRRAGDGSRTNTSHESSPSSRLGPAVTRPAATTLIDMKTSWLSAEMTRPSDLPERIEPRSGCSAVEKSRHQGRQAPMGR